MSVTSDFSLVSTVFNEANRLERTIDDLESQTLRPSEIVITDAGSTDGTYEKLLHWRDRSAIPIIVLQKHRCNVAEGRNLAIRAARHNLIASTDFGCRFHPKWLESLMAPFSNPEVRAVGGAFAVIDEDLDTLPAKAAYLLFNGYQDNIHQPWFTPTSRSIAYYKEVFDLVGGYCEWLTLAADDTIFGRLAKKKGIKFHMVDNPYVYWGRHKTNIAYAKEAFRYGLGDGESGINKRSAISNFIEMALRYTGVVLLITAIVLCSRNVIPSMSFLVLIPFAFGLRSYFHYLTTWLRLKSAKYNFWVFVHGFYLLEQTRIYYLKGYYKGFFKSPDFRRKAAKELSQELAL